LDTHDWREEMLTWILRILVILAGPIVGYFQVSSDAQGILIGTTVAVLILFIEVIIERIPLDTLIAGILGAVIGLIAAKVLDYTIYLMENPKLYELMRTYSLLIKISFAYLGLVIAVRKKSELSLLDRDIFARGPTKKVQELKILDTSAIIDGRIADICDTKFLSATLIVPRFVLKELQDIADSSDPIKRARGRRGLEILSRLQECPEVNIKIFDKDYPEVKETDLKLINLAKDIQARILTTDFNLNKVAGIEGVTVLNVNDLSNALKPVVLPGEPMSIFVVKEGKERDQGIGYLDDGTMVVVEEGRRYIGKKIDVLVTSIIQTSAGRMIFTRPV